MRLFVQLICYWILSCFAGYRTEATAIVMSACGNVTEMVAECFKELPTHLLAFLQTPKTPKNDINAGDIIAKCSAFQNGMQCFDTYTRHCLLPQQQKQFFRKNVQGARKFFQRFCVDAGFRRDYLHHRDCYVRIQHEWANCAHNFRRILNEELHLTRHNVTHKLEQFCCARSVYEDCIYDSARRKCYPQSIQFARYTAKTLSEEKHFREDCRQYIEQAVNCRAGSKRNVPWTLLSLLWLQFVQFMVYDYFHRTLHYKFFTVEL